MVWKKVDFIGISLNDSTLVDKLDHFLANHEEYIFQALLKAVSDYTGHEIKVDPEKTLSLDDTLNLIENNLSQNTVNQEIELKKSSWHTLLKNIKAMLWEQVELVEGFVRELFLQLSYVSILKWQNSLNDIIRGFEKIISEHIETSKEIVASLQEVFQRYLSKHSELEKSSWIPFISSKHPIDPTLIKDLDDSNKVLKLQAVQFLEQYSQFSKVSNDINQQISKLKSYEALSTLGNSTSDQFVELYRFLKLWENLGNFQHVSQESLLRAFQSFSRDKTFQVLNKYYHALEHQLYDKSRIIKTSPVQLFADSQGRSFLLETVKSFRNEVHVLGATIAKLKDFIYREHPDPYVRARWGYADSPVTATPKFAYKLNNLGLDIDQLNIWYNKFIESLERGPLTDDHLRLDHIDNEIQKALHILAHPLLSTNQLRSHIEKALYLLEEANELGAFGRSRVDYTRQVLSKLLKADWKDHILLEIPLFNKLYKLHQGIIGPAIDSAHEVRLQALSNLCTSILKKAHIEESMHDHDIDYDINDVKGYLQDFFALLQRSLNDEEVSAKKAYRQVEEGMQQLLEYRYLFANFFSKLKNEPEGPYLRHQLLYVDQYFEAIENKLVEYRLQKGIMPSYQEQS